MQQPHLKRPGRGPSGSCTECRRRKQKCDQARGKPCNHCARRYPPPLCVYESDKWKPSNTVEFPFRTSRRSEIAQKDDRQLEVSGKPPFGELDPVNSTLLGRIWKSGQSGPSPMVGSGTALDDLYFLPIEQTIRNAELFYCFHQSLGLYTATIDGKDPPVAFYKTFMSTIIQSPLAAGLPLLSASCYQAAIRGIEVQKCAEAISMENRTMSLIRKHIEKNKRDIQLDAILAVFLLIENEWHWCYDEYKLRTHMRGLKELLRLRGGIETISIDSWVRRQIILGDYQIACCTEKSLFLIDHQQEDEDLPPLNSTLALFDNPLYASSTHRTDIIQFRYLGLPTVNILGDMKVLTHSLLATLSVIIDPAAAIAKFEATALWTYDRIAALPSKAPTPSSSADDLLYEIIRLTGLIYCKAITSRTSFSMLSQPALCASLWQTMWLVSLSRWKETPGIFLWVLLVACTSMEHRAQRAFLKMNIWMVTMYIDLSSHEVVVGCLNTFLKVQRWIKDTPKA